MRSPATEAARRLRDSVEAYIQTAQDAPRGRLKDLHDLHSWLADEQLIGGDVFAAALHANLATLYIAHKLTDIAAEVVSLGGPNPLEDEA